MFEFRAIPSAYDHTRERLWVERMGEQPGKEFSHMMHDRRRVLNVFTELLVLVRFEAEADHAKRMVLHSFTSMVRDAFWRDVLISLCKFGDHTMGKKPLSLPSWMKRNTTDMPPEALEALNTKVEAFMMALKPIRVLRNKRLAHADSEATLSSEPSSVSLEQSADAFQALAICLDYLERMHGIEPLRDLPYESSFGGAESFVNMLNSCTLEHP